MWRVFCGLVVYHMVIGVWVVFFGVQFDPEYKPKPTVLEYAQLVVFWPATVSMTNYMQAFATNTMNDTKAILEELNTGRWERKP